MNISSINNFSIASRARQSNIAFGRRNRDERYTNGICSSYPSHNELAQSEIELTKKVVQQNIFKMPPKFGYSERELPNGILREDYRFRTGGQSKYYKPGQELPYISCQYNGKLVVQSICVENEYDYLYDCD